MRPVGARKHLPRAKGTAVGLDPVSSRLGLRSRWSKRDPVPPASLEPRSASVLRLVAIGNTKFSMKTVTVKLPDELAVRVEKRAKRLGVSKSALLRDSLERSLGGDADIVEEEPSAYDLMKEGCGCVESGVRDLATNPKHLEGLGR